MAHPDATIIWGAQLDDTLEDTIRVTVVATGLGDDKKEEKNNDLASLLGNTSADDDETASENVRLTHRIPASSYPAKALATGGDGDGRRPR